MKAVILAGGFGTRLSEETSVRPKPMVEVGGRPLLWHIMKLYSAYGIDDFVVCCGYKAQIIKDYFASYVLNAATDVTFDLARNEIHMRTGSVEPWRVTLLDTGDATMTGGRLRRAADHLREETFCFTYGDCVSNVDVNGLIKFHRAQGVLATVTAIRPPGRFGALIISPDESRISHFVEKPEDEGGWVNGGFFVAEPRALDYIEGDDSVWEGEPLARLAREGELAAYVHHGYWQNMDTLRDRMVLEEQWASGSPPWRVWGEDDRREELPAQKS
jgi:glucose-1-phosphate cytidylyltransferase